MTTSPTVTRATNISWSPEKKEPAPVGTYDPKEQIINYVKRSNCSSAIQDSLARKISASTGGTINNLNNIQDTNLANKKMSGIAGGGGRGIVTTTTSSKTRLSRDSNKVQQQSINGSIVSNVIGGVTGTTNTSHGTTIAVSDQQNNQDLINQQQNIQLNSNSSGKVSGNKNVLARRETIGDADFELSYCGEASQEIFDNHCHDHVVDECEQKLDSVGGEQCAVQIRNGKEDIDQIQQNNSTTTFEHQAFNNINQNQSNQPNQNLNQELSDQNLKSKKSEDSSFRARTPLPGTGDFQKLVDEAEAALVTSQPEQQQQPQVQSDKRDNQTFNIVKCELNGTEVNSNPIFTKQIQGQQQNQIQNVTLNLNQSQNQTNDFDNQNGNPYSTPVQDHVIKTVIQPNQNQNNITNVLKGNDLAHTNPIMNAQAENIGAKNDISVNVNYDANAYMSNNQNINPNTNQNMIQMSLNQKLNTSNISVMNNNYGPQYQQTSTNIHNNNNSSNFRSGPYQQQYQNQNHQYNHQNLQQYSQQNQMSLNHSNMQQQPNCLNNVNTNDNAHMQLQQINTSPSPMITNSAPNKKKQSDSYPVPFIFRQEIGRKSSGHVLPLRASDGIGVRLFTFGDYGGLRYILEEYFQMRGRISEHTHFCCESDNSDEEGPNTERSVFQSIINAQNWSRNNTKTPKFNFTNSDTESIPSNTTFAGLGDHTDQQTPSANNDLNLLLINRPLPGTVTGPGPGTSGISNGTTNRIRLCMDKVSQVLSSNGICKAAILMTGHASELREPLNIREMKRIAMANMRVYRTNFVSDCTSIPLSKLSTGGWPPEFPKEKLPPIDHLIQILEKLFVKASQ